VLDRLESPDGVLAFRGVGKIEKADYETMLEPAIEDAIVQRDEVRLVYLLGDEFEGYSAAAGWEDTKLGVGHLSKWKRIAVVTSHDWVRHSVGMFRWMVPGEVKVFPVAELGAAMEWAAA
jgi:hypothetical protein